jgi:hypothetical protein
MGRDVAALIAAIEARLGAERDAIARLRQSWDVCSVGLAL